MLLLVLNPDSSLCLPKEATVGGSADLLPLLAIEGIHGVTHGRSHTVETAFVRNAPATRSQAAEEVMGRIVMPHLKGAAERNSLMKAGNGKGTSCHQRSAVSGMPVLPVFMIAVTVHFRPIKGAALRAIQRNGDL